MSLIQVARYIGDYLGVISNRQYGFCTISIAASNALWQVLIKISSSPLTFGLFIPLQQDHDYERRANSCTVIKAAYKARRDWSGGEKF